MASVEDRWHRKVNGRKVRTELYGVGGQWRARYRTPDGTSRGKVFERKIDAERFLTSMEHSKLSGAYVDPSAGKVTVGTYWAVWSGRQVWRDSSRRQAESYFRNHLEPTLGRRPLNSLRRGDVEAFGAGLELAPRSAQQVLRYLSSLLDAAVADGLIAMNPARGAARPKIDVEPVQPFTAAEVAALREATPAWFDVALDLGLGAGLRQGEACGITVDRVDFLRRQLRVDRQLLSLPAGKWRFGPPKTSRGHRTVPLADVVVDALAAHLAEHGPGESGLILHRPDGSAVRSHIFENAWARARRRAGLGPVDADQDGDGGRPGARFHTARHTFASTLLSGGVSVPAAAEYLGHTPGELLRTYAHLLPADHDRARAIVQEAFTESSRVTLVSREGPAAETLTAAEN